MKILLMTAALALLAQAPSVEAELAVPKSPIASSHVRELPLQGGQNFRDLGGYRTSDGRSVRWGLLYRSGSMHFLTNSDYAYLEKRGIRTVCDFRDVSERASEPAIWPAGKAPHVLADDYHMDMSAMSNSSLGHVPTAADAQATMRTVYPQLLNQFNSQYRRMFGELLAGHAPLAFNCTAGKDRTGVAAALLLSALGVPRATVVEDYTLTNRYFDPNKVVHSDSQSSRQWKALPPEVLKAYMVADPTYIEAVFKVLDAHRGGMDGYFEDELGLTKAKLDQLRRIYTVRVDA